MRTSSLFPEFVRSTPSASERCLIHARQERLTLGKQAKTDDETWRKATGSQGDEPAPPRRLTTAQIVRSCTCPEESAL